jgi:dTDP-4-dehydrorhamnose reductase
LLLNNRILLTGATGQVGTALRPLLASLGEVVAPDRSRLDLGDAASIRKAIVEVQPRWIIHPGAYTAVDRAETEAESAHVVNAVAPGIIGEEAKRIGAAVITFSTDYVFDGSGSTPWKETDRTGPLNIYGQTKLDGELALAASGAAHLIFRTSWVYSALGKSFLGTISKLAREKDKLTIIDDQHGAPTSASDLAEMTAHLIRQMEASGEGRSSEHLVGSRTGVYHAAGTGETTWYEFAKHIVAFGKARYPDQTFAEILPIPTKEYPTPAKRPLNSRLDCTKLQENFGWRMPAWTESVDSALALRMAAAG